jgi:hypothetical protein
VERAILYASLIISFLFSLEERDCLKMEEDEDDIV